MSIKGLGLSGKVLHRMMTKQAFMNIGKRSMLHTTSAPPLADPYRAAWRESHGGKMSWSTRMSGKECRFVYYGKGVEEKEVKNRRLWVSID